MHEDRHFFRPDEFADRFRISLRSVYRMIKRKKILVVDINGMLRIPKKEYCKFCRASNGCRPCEWKEKAKKVSR
jgi:hypothetical protein